jgi:beta-glucosidase
VTFTLTPENRAPLNRDMHWADEPGEFEVMVGRSSEDIREKGTFLVKD